VFERNTPTEGAVRVERKTSGESRKNATNRRTNAGLNHRRSQPRPALRDDLPVPGSLFDRPQHTLSGDLL
jgi:hypothetical protein